MFNPALQNVLLRAVSKIQRIHTTSDIEINQKITLPEEDLLHFQGRTKDGKPKKEYCDRYHIFTTS